MSIRNYTSEVPASQSMNDIERILIGMGARNIAKEYDDNGKVLAIMFGIPKDGSTVPVKLPGRVTALRDLFLREYRQRITKEMRERAEKQAERTAWKNVKEWVELQAAMIKLEQVEFMEVFMPYIYRMDQGKTVYELARDNQFQKLLS